MKSLRKQRQKQETFYSDQGKKRPLQAGVDLSLHKVDPRLKFDVAVFEEELKSLKGLPMSEKLVGRQALTEKYAPQISTFLASGEKENLIFSWLLQWQFDLGKLDQYFEWMKIAITRKMTPAHTRKKKSFVDCMVYDVLDWAEDQHKEKLSCSPYLERMIELVPNWEDIPKKQYLQALYLQFHNMLRAGDNEKTIEFGKQAYKAGAAVKTILKELFVEQYGKEEANENWKIFCKTEGLRK